MAPKEGDADAIARTRSSRVDTMSLVEKKAVGAFETKENTELGNEEACIEMVARAGQAGEGGEGGEGEGDADDVDEDPEEFVEEAGAAGGGWMPSWATGWFTFGLVH